MMREATEVVNGAYLGAPSMQALACEDGRPVVILQERNRPDAEGFSRYFMAMIHMPDADDMRYEAGSNTEAVVYEVLEKYPNARILLRSFDRAGHFDYFEAEPPLERESSLSINRPLQNPLTAEKPSAMRSAAPPATHPSTKLRTAAVLDLVASSRSSATQQYVP